MAARRRNPSDFTGKERDALANANREELQKRDKEIAMLNAAEAKEKTKVVDMTTDPTGAIEYEDDGLDEDDTAPAVTVVGGVVDLTENAPVGDAAPFVVTSVIEQPLVVEEPFRVIRVNADLSQVAIGAGTSYDFEEGRKYRVPKNVADHLEEKGYVWH